MKLQNLKLDKERQRNLRSKNDKAFRRKREYLRHGGYERRWERAPIAWETTFLTVATNLLQIRATNLIYEWMSEEWEWVSLRGRRERVWVSACVWNFLVCVLVMSRCVFVCLSDCELNEPWISSLINSISTWLHLAFLSN